MINPALAPPIPCELDVDKSNGKGYWSFMPADPISVQAGVDVIRDYGHFSEMPSIVDQAVVSGSVLVQGEPGSGKSHIVRELQEGCMVAGVPCFCLTVHINGAKPTGIEAIAAPLAAFREATKESGGIVILDNLDFVGYKGHARSKGAIRRYAQAAAPVFADLLQDPQLKVVGLAHDDAWREHHWTADDPTIDEPAKEVLSGFKSRLVFEGRMALVGLVDIIRERAAVKQAADADAGIDTSTQPEGGITVGRAARVVRALHTLGRGNFFHANHVDPTLFLQNPDAALAEIDAGRTVRTTRVKL